MYYVIGEPEYENSMWYKRIFEGLILEKRKKRFALTMLSDIRALSDLALSDEDMIFVIGTDSLWLSQTVSICERYFDNRVIVLGNHTRRLDGKKYSIVTADIAHDIRVLYTYLRSCKKERIALYGINPNSVSDAFKRESFLSCNPSEADLFYNDDSPSACFSDFMEHRQDYDAVICVNDYVAISLLRHLGAHRNGLFLTSCGGSMLANFFFPSITHMRIDYDAFGKAGIDLCALLQKNKSINSLDIRLASDFFAGDTTDQCILATPQREERIVIDKRDDSFYQDSEIDEMLRVETLLNSCDGDDFAILKHLLWGETYETIADALILSVNGLKYKLKNMFSICRVSTKKEFVAMISKYIILPYKH